MDNKLQEVIAKLLQRRETIMLTGNAQIQEIGNTLALLGYVEPKQVANDVPVTDSKQPKGEK